MKTILISVFGILMLICIGLLSYKINSLNTEHQQKLESIESINHAVETNVITSYLYNNKFIDTTLFSKRAVSNINSTSSPTIFFWFNSNHCETCIFHSLNLIKEYTRTHKTLKFIMLTNESNRVGIRTWEAKEKAGFDYKYYKDSADLPFKDLYVPCMFTIDKTSFIKNFFIPAKENDQLTLGYLNLLFSNTNL